MKKIYCLYDTVSEESGPLFEARNDEMAQRIYNSMKPENLPPGSDLKDFRVLCLGSYFTGDAGNMPYLLGLSKSKDITRVHIVDGEEQELEAV